MTDDDQRAVRQRRIVATIRRGGVDQHEFDTEFWRTVPPEQRVEAIWDLVLELRRIREEDGGEPRLDRTVERIQRP